ncbi:MAG: hypothetical protein HRO68_07655 [Nitrosopumilus sp.]|nr:hypothetical protein [Nitrosopumilus sp.]
MSNQQVSKKIPASILNILFWNTSSSWIFLMIPLISYIWFFPDENIFKESIVSVFEFVQYNAVFTDNLFSDIQLAIIHILFTITHLILIVACPIVIQNAVKDTHHFTQEIKHNHGWSKIPQISITGIMILSVFLLMIISFIYLEETIITVQTFSEKTETLISQLIDIWSQISITDTLLVLLCVLVFNLSLLMASRGNCSAGDNNEK